MQGGASCVSPSDFDGANDAGNAVIVGAPTLAKTATAAAFVEEAAGWAHFLLKQEARGHGDTEAAIGRAARKAGVPRSRFWSLVRRPQALKDIGTSIYFALYAAYEAECERQQRLLEHELAITKARAGARSALARAAARMGGAQDHDAEL